MKNYLVFCFVLLAFSLKITAQTFDDPRERLTAGIKAGLNIANVWDSEGEDFQANARAGFAGGVFVGIPIGTYLGVQPEILISQKGFQGFGTLLGTSYTFSRTTTYIDVPILLQVKPTEFLTILLGPEYSYLMHQKNVFTVGSNTLVQEEAFNDEQIRKNIFGVVGGLDFSVSHFVFAPRIGLDLLNNNGDGTSTTPRYKNRWMQLTVGIKL